MLKRNMLKEKKDLFWLIVSRIAGFMALSVRRDMVMEACGKVPYLTSARKQREKGCRQDMSF